MSRLLVGWTRCDGHGLCARLLPEMAQLDEWGVPPVSPLTADERDVKTAVANCPASRSASRSDITTARTPIQ